MLDKIDLQELIENPREALHIELKSWIDTNTNEGIAKLIKACVALYNYNGGYLIIGINNDDHNPSEDIKKHNNNIKDIFNNDHIQLLVSKYISTPIEILINFLEKDNIKFPVITIPSGVRSPVHTKSEIRDINNKPIILANKVYVRTLESNGTVSSSEPKGKDWDQLIERCLENLEADIGRFVSRHLTPMQIHAFSTTFKNIVLNQDIHTKAVEHLLDQCFGDLEKKAKQAKIELPEASFELSAVIDGVSTIKHSPNKSFINLIKKYYRAYSGRSFWSDSTKNPEFIKNYIETIYQNLENSIVVKFWRIYPEGKLYYYSVLQELLFLPESQIFDAPSKILITAETLTNLLELVKAMGFDKDQTQVLITYRWVGLKDRHLGAADNLMENLFYTDNSHPANDNYCVTNAIIPLNTSQSSISIYTHELVKPLFEKFGGFEIQLKKVNEIVDRMFNNQL